MSAARAGAETAMNQAPATNLKCVIIALCDIVSLALNAWRR